MQVYQAVGAIMRAFANIQDSVIHEEHLAARCVPHHYELLPLR